MLEQEGFRGSTVPVVARALCQFPGGEARTLYATDITPNRAFIVSVRPPPVRTPVVVTFCPTGGDELPPISARVVATRLDPTDVAGSGFGVLFTELSDEATAALGSALSALGLTRDDARQPQVAERREHPRVLPSLELKAQLDTTAGRLSATVANLSLSGALLAYASPDTAEALAVGTVVSVDLVDQHGLEVAALDARVVRLTRPAEPSGVGVVFVDVDELTLARIERLILNVLGDIDEPFGD